MTTRERLTARADRRDVWATKAHAASDAAYSTARRIGDGIPLGQPILIGHHSERHARRDQDRIHSAMTRSVERDRMATHHATAADGIRFALDRSIYSDDSDALDALRERVDALTALRDRMSALNRLYRKDTDAARAAWTAEADAIFARVGDTRRSWESPPFPTFTLSNLGGRIRSAKQRMVDVERRQQRTAAAEASPEGVTVTGADYVAVTFADKPARPILDALKAAGFHWSGGAWCGYRAQLPTDVAAMIGGAA